MSKPPLFQYKRPQIETEENNIVVYNFPECADRKADEAFQTLLSTVFSLKVVPTKTIRLGPKIANKHRPLLLSIDDLDLKGSVLSRSHFCAVMISTNLFSLFLTEPS